ncbi:MAG: hypothetical protein V4547_15280 [Bacteroidota bacterium]
MKKECKIFIIEPERIVGLELQQQLEKNGYSVFQSHSLADIETFESSYSSNLIIVNIDKEWSDNHEEIKKILNRPWLSAICISTDKQKMKEKEYKGLNIIGVFLKPFDTKEIVSLVDKYNGIGKNHPII